MTKLAPSAINRSRRRAEEKQTCRVLFCGLDVSSIRKPRLLSDDLNSGIQIRALFPILSRIDLQSKSPFREKFRETHFCIASLQSGQEDWLLSYIPIRIQPAPLSRTRRHIRKVQYGSDAVPFGIWYRFPNIYQSAPILSEQRIPAKTNPSGSLQANCAYRSIDAMEFDDYERLPSTSVATNMTAGASAGVLEHCIMYPMDSVKVFLSAPKHTHAHNHLANTCSHHPCVNTRYHTFAPLHPTHSIHTLTHAPLS